MDVAQAIVHIGVVLAASGPFSADQVHALKSESAAIWQPYGVHISWFDEGDDCSANAHAWRFPSGRILRVVADDSDPPNVALGSVRFRAGVPGDTIALRYTPLSRLVLDAAIGSYWFVRALPAPLRDQLVGRALGRVLAHEIGHVLLGAPTHAPAGLMRPSFTAADLLASDHAHLRLPRADLARLRASISP